MRTITLLAFTLSALAAAAPDSPDVNAIVRKALTREIERQQKLASYTWEESTVEKVFDSKGKSMSAHAKVFENLVIDGSEYRHQIAEDGKPLSEDRARKERAK